MSRKVTHAAARIKLGLQDVLKMGNLEAKRDWGFAGDYVEAMWMMLQQEKPEDYVIATGAAHSVKYLISISFSHMGLNWEEYVVKDQGLIRPAEVDYLLGNPTKAREKMGWKPKLSFEEMIRIMVEEDYKILKNQVSKSGLH